MGIGFIIGSKGHRVKDKYGVKGLEGCRVLSFLRPFATSPLYLPSLRPYFFAPCYLTLAPYLEGGRQ